MIDPNIMQDMWNEREIRFQLIPLWLKALVVALIVGALVYQIYAYGVDTERAKWQLKESKELTEKQSKILELTVLNRELERSSNLRANALKTVYEGKLKDEKIKADRIFASLANGAKRLSIGTKATNVCASKASGATAVATTGQTETRAELSDESNRFLVGEAVRANGIVLESNYMKDLLIACYDHVEALSKQEVK